MSPFIFTSERGAPFTTAGFRKMIARLGVVAGFGFLVHPHMLRHACGYHLANRGRRYSVPAGLSRASKHPAYRALHRAGADPLQELLARLIGPARLMLATSISSGMFRDRPAIEATSSPLGELPSRTRSAVTNHKDLLPGLDGRSASARRFRDLVNAIVGDMGGLDRCSEKARAGAPPRRHHRKGRDTRGAHGGRRADRRRPRSARLPRLRSALLRVLGLERRATNR